MEQPTLMGRCAHFEWSATADDDALRVTFRGELDLAALDALHGFFYDAMNRETNPVILDLRELQVIDSTGLSLILRLKRAREHGGRRLLLEGVRANVFRVFEVSGCADAFTYAEGVQLEQA
jgi:anti-anti-sigma factor